MEILSPWKHLFPWKQMSYAESIETVFIRNPQKQCHYRIHGNTNLHGNGVPSSPSSPSMKTVEDYCGVLHIHTSNLCHVCKCVSLVLSPSCSCSSPRWRTVRNWCSDSSPTLCSWQQTSCCIGGHLLESIHSIFLIFNIVFLASCDSVCIVLYWTVLCCIVCMYVCYCIVLYT